MKTTQGHTKRHYPTEIDQKITSKQDEYLFVKLNTFCLIALKMSIDHWPMTAFFLQYLSDKNQQSEPWLTTHVTKLHKTRPFNSLL